jgi:hypothetical protein
MSPSTYTSCPGIGFLERHVAQVRLHHSFQILAIEQIAVVMKMLEPREPTTVLVFADEDSQISMAELL